MCWRDVTAGGGAGRPGSFPLLLPGCRGASVRHLQEKLQATGFDPGPADGIYGLLTAAAVRELQHIFGLREDGLAGPEVWRVLNDPEAMATRLRGRLQPGEDLEALPLTYRLAWPKSGQPGFGRTSSGGWSGTIWAASMPHLSGVVTHVLIPNPPPAASGLLWNWLPLGDLPDKVARAGCDRWVLLPARAARELVLTLGAARPRGPASSVSRPEERRRQGRGSGGWPARGGSGKPESPGPEHREIAAPGWSDRNDGSGWKGLLVDAGGFRLPAQLPDLLGLLATLRELQAGHAGGDREAGATAWATAGSSRLEVVLPAVPAAANPFWRAFSQACARLAGRADRLWLSAFRRPEDWGVSGRPLHLVELERTLAIARETWAPWRLGVVLPAGGWWADGRPLARREVLALRQRQRRPRAAAKRAVMPPAPAAASWRAAAGPPAAVPRDEASGLLLLGRAEAGAVPEAYLADQETWRALLGRAHAAGVGGLAVHPWGEEHPSLWEVFPEFSGRLDGDKEASPPAGGI